MSMVRSLLLLAPLLAWGQQAPSTPAGQLQDRDLKIRQTDDGVKAQPGAPKGFALIIGIGQYQNLPAASSLRFSESDAEAFYRVLISPEAGGFATENVHKLIGPQATLANLRHELEDWLPSVARPEDRVVVYYAGHGLVAGGRGFLAPYDIALANIEVSGYPMAQLAKVLSKDVKSTKKVLFTDACHSGKITPESTDENISAQISKIENPYFLTLTATSEREQSYESAQLSTGFGVFTYFLVQGLQGAADSSPCDGKVTADELVSYVTRNVRDFVRQRNAYQTPVALGDYDPAMVLALSHGCASAKDSQVSDIGTIVVESNMDDVELYVDDKLVGTISKAKPLSLPGLSGGVHIFKGVRKGYQPDTKQQTVIPGETGSVRIRIQYPIETKKAALDLIEQGERKLFTQRSSFDPLYFARQSQSAQSVQEAAQLFAKALKEDPKAARAAYDAGIAEQLLANEKESLANFKRAVDIDPSYVDARIQYSSVLIETGDPDEAIRQLVEALRLDPKSDLAEANLSRAYLDKDVYDRAIDAGTKAVQLRPANEQAYLWRAEAARRKAEEERTGKTAPSADIRTETERARDDFRTYIEKTDFSNPVYQKLAFYFIGFGVGSRAHADRQQSYAYQRSMAYSGLCSCEISLGNPMKGSEYCRRALQYDSKDPVALFLLGNAYRDLFNSYKRYTDLVAARKSYSDSVAMNPDLEFSKTAKGYIEQIDVLLAKPELRKQMN